MTLRERWEHYLSASTSTLTEDYLQEVFPLNSSSDSVFINGALFANKHLVNAIQALNPEERLIKDDLIIAARVSEGAISFDKGISINTTPNDITYDGELDLLEHIWDIFSKNGAYIKSDFELLTKGRSSQPIPNDIVTRNKEHIFIEEGAVISPGCILNAEGGPIYIGKDAELMEGAILRGPIAVCEHAAVKMGAKIYGDTTIGYGCKVGGEVGNTVFFANSNKGHDGYLGNAVVGEWCNLGADTNSSNLKNNYDHIKIWDEHNFKSVQTGLTFCGLMMGDHSKCGINTMFNTGTVVGVSANIYGGGFPEKFIPSFSWGGSEGMTAYKLDRAIDTANRMMARRNKNLSEAEIKMFEHIFAATQRQRDLFANNK